MKALGLKDRFGPAVLDGSKPFTLRRAWKNGLTPDLCERLSLIHGSRTPQRREFATCLVGFRGTIFFRKYVVIGVAAWRVMGTFREDAARVYLAATRAVDPAFADAFARLDGFSSYADFWGFHGAHRAPSADEVVTREIIGLCAVTASYAEAAR